ncbi:MAG: DUF4338 domain-containing protein [Candidatus Parvarchaeota archaeon]
MGENNEQEMWEELTQEERDSLRERIFKNLIESGFSVVNSRRLIVPQNKDFIRKVHASAVKFIRDDNREFIEKFDDEILRKFIIDGKDLDIANIQPVLKLINNKLDNVVFDWIKLHWSIPTSSGYGRRLRYVVYDKGNFAVIGIIGLADPVFGLGDRDRYIGWSSDVRKRNLKYVMDAFVLGAVPPYSQVLGGKLVASLLLDYKIVRDFRKKYKGTKSLISGEVFNGKLAAITTASALGKSSVYDRIKIPGTSGFLHVGWSKGSGEFQFFNGVYDELFKFAHGQASQSKNKKWGTGVRNRRTVIKAGLKILGLPSDLLYHNIPRELFIIPLGSKSFDYLNERSVQIRYYRKDTEELSNFAIKRWMLPRSIRRPEYLNFRKESYSLVQK